MNRPTVLFYSVPDCPYCGTARAWLKERTIDFVECDVSADYRGLCDMIFQFGLDEVPALLVGYKGATGFDPDAWQEVLDHAAEVGKKDPFELRRSSGPNPIKL